jgi:hypothetical protein
LRDGASRLLLPAAQALPHCRRRDRLPRLATFRSYLLTLDLRPVLAAQQWRVIGIAASTWP